MKGLLVRSHKEELLGQAVKSDRFSVKTLVLLLEARPYRKSFVDQCFELSVTASLSLRHN